MTWLLIPGDDRPAARKLASEIDRVLGYPRTHDEGELIRRGRRPRGGWPAVRTETQLDIRVHDDTGAEVLHGAIAIRVDEVLDALRERHVRNVDGIRQRVREIIAARGWEVRANLPGVEAAWTRVLPRDGAEGSATGVPIAPGEE